MFFENEAVSFNLLDVLEIKQSVFDKPNAGRNFCALSFRIRTDAVLKSAKGEYQMHDNSVAFVPARLNYSRTATVDELIVIHFEVINCHTNDIEVFLPKDPEVLGNLFNKILACWNEKKTGYKYQCAAVLNEILAECYAQNFKRQANNSKIQQAVEFMDAHFTNPRLTIQEIASQSFISEVYFRKLFKQEYGLSPQKYLVQLRIRHAAGLISTGYYSLKEIASMAGYPDYKYFSTEFKKQMGTSPSEYVYNYPKQQR